MRVWFALRRPFSLFRASRAKENLIRRARFLPALLVPAAHDDRRVVASDAERGRDRDVEVWDAARLVRDVVEVAVGTAVVVVNRRGIITVDGRLPGEHRLD